MPTRTTILEKLAAYNNWANERVLENLETLPTSPPAYCLQQLSHIFNAQVIWLSRMEQVPSPLGDSFAAHSLAQCRAFHRATADRLVALAEMPREQLNQVIAYTNLQGQPFETALEDILTHLFNHSTYHRAQVARELRQHDLDPIGTDFILYVRELSVLSTPV